MMLIFLAPFLQVREIHRTLLRALAIELVPGPLVQGLKCLGVLVLNTPYSHLAPVGSGSGSSGGGGSVVVVAVVVVVVMVVAV